MTPYWDTFFQWNIGIGANILVLNVRESWTNKQNILKYILYTVVHINKE